MGEHMKKAFMFMYIHVCLLLGYKIQTQIHTHILKNLAPNLRLRSPTIFNKDDVYLWAAMLNCLQQKKRCCHVTAMEQTLTAQR